MREEILVLNGISMHYKIVGQGPAILILHGWGRGSDSWVEVQEKLAQAGYLVVVPDLPGFGQSGAPKEAWGVDRYAEFVKEFAEKLNLGTFVLLGHSFGGQVALKFALQNPAMLKGLVLYAAAVIRRAPSRKARTIGVFAKAGNAVLSLRPLSFFQPLAKKLLYRILGSTDYLYERGIMKKVREKVLREDLSSYLPKVQTRTFILWGEYDTITPLEDAHTIRRTMPHAALVAVPGAGHRMHQDMPDRVSKNILEFARKL